jgi:F-type H+-transporting ATPase subunit gamma
MAKGRELKGRIKSVENTRKITRTMEMVATSKMKRAQDRVVAARPYAAALRDVISSLYSTDLAERFALLRQPATIRRAAILVLTSNRGLAGAFNANLLREARTQIERLEREGVAVELHVVGRKGVGYFRYVGREMASTRMDLTDRPSVQDATDLIKGPTEAFINGSLDAVYVIYARFISALSTPPATDRLLPVTPPGAAAAAPADKPRAPGERPAAAQRAVQHDYILIPSAEEILEQLLPAYVRNSVYRALVETAAAEQGARRTAMKNATDNANDVINGLRRQYNRARQAQITQEIAEIVGGAAALGG